MKWLGSSIYLRDVKKGARFYESEYGCCIEWMALEDVRESKMETEDRKQYRCKCKTPKGEELELLQTEGLEHYGPKLYRIEKERHDTQSEE